MDYTPLLFATMFSVSTELVTSALRQAHIWQGIKKRKKERNTSSEHQRLRSKISMQICKTSKPFPADIRKALLHVPHVLSFPQIIPHDFPNSQIFHLVTHSTFSTVISPARLKIAIQSSGKLNKVLFTVKKITSLRLFFNDDNASANQRFWQNKGMKTCSIAWSLSLFLAQWVGLPPLESDLLDSNPEFV